MKEREEERKEGRKEEKERKKERKRKKEKEKRRIWKTFPRFLHSGHVFIFLMKRIQVGFL